MVKMFPDEEVTKITPNVFIHRLPYEGGIFRVYFNVGVQYFQIGIDQTDMEGAEFTAKMLVKALEKFKGS